MVIRILTEKIRGVKRQQVTDGRSDLSGDGMERMGTVFRLGGAWEPGRIAGGIRARRGTLAVQSLRCATSRIFWWSA